MRAFRILAALLLTTSAVIACSDEIVSPGEIVVESIKGDGTIDLSSAAVANGTFSVDAQKMGDGTYRGTFTQKRAGSGGNIEFVARVTCIAVDTVNHRGWLGGVVQENRSTDPAARVDSLHSVGKDVWFRVLDKATNATDRIDRSTTLGFRGAAGFLTSVDYCAGKPWPDLDARTFPLAAGNVEVK